MSGDFQDEIECLGIEASPSFVREPEGNGVAERFIRTLKESLLWMRTFDIIEELPRHAQRQTPLPAPGRGSARIPFSCAARLARSTPFRRHRLD
jgi:transposase InsO family protein